MKTKKNIKSIAALFLCVILMLTAGCAKGTEKEQTAGTTSGKALAEMNDIPADGIITWPAKSRRFSLKEQLKME